MQKRRIEKKRVILNILTVVGLILAALLILYIVYIVKQQTSESVPMSELQGRLYASETGEVQLRFYTEEEILFKDGEARKTFREYECKDGIIILSETEEAGEEYTFLILTGDRLFYDDGREVLYLVWYG